MSYLINVASFAVVRAVTTFPKQPSPAFVRSTTILNLTQAYDFMHVRLVKMGVLT